jgi:hypothetical protein
MRKISDATFYIFFSLFLTLILLYIAMTWNASVMEAKEYISISFCNKFLTDNLLDYKGSFVNNTNITIDKRE